jgi:hypothetical protein
MINNNINNNYKNQFFYDPLDKKTYNPLTLVYIKAGIKNGPQIGDATPNIPPIKLPTIPVKVKWATLDIVESFSLVLLLFISSSPNCKPLYNPYNMQHTMVVA